MSEVALPQAIELIVHPDDGWTRRCISCKHLNRKCACKKMVSVENGKMYPIYIKHPRKTTCAEWTYSS